ncbi:MAG: hypothetical protein N3B01_12350, partial [Verrucomicrobiae bacterium]|nr:hypothetical protein [Verrucomicrobiae bacterium]
MRKRICQSMKQVCFVIWVCAAAAAMAAEVVPRLTVDGKTYHDVRWGPVNDGKVVIFHSRGNAVVPLGSLPAEYQALLTRSGMPSARAVGTNAAVGASSEPLPRSMVGAASESQKGDWGEYNRERKSKLVLNNRLVDRSELMSLVGFVGNPVRIYTDTVKVSGVLFELAEKRGDVTQPAE